jgi:hypothetical protein
MLERGQLNLVHPELSGAGRALVLAGELDAMDEHAEPVGGTFRFGHHGHEMVHRS